MLGQCQGGSLVVATDVLGHAGRDAGDAGLLPRRALGNVDERLHGCTDVVRAHRAAGAVAVAELGHRPVVGRAQTVGLVDGRVQAGIVAGRQLARHGLGAVVVDRLGELLHNRLG